MKADVCPDRRLLGSHLLGKVRGETAELIDRHLAECESCLNVARELNLHDPFTSVMRRGKPPQAEKDLEVAAVVERAKQLLAVHDASGAGETLSTQTTADGEGPPASGDEDEDDLTFLAPPELPDEIGRLGGYRVLEVLGRGGMGIVFRAEDPVLQRVIALKAMRPSLAARKSARRRFLQEAKATAAIEHDHIVTIHQVSEDGEIPYLAMQFLRGESLQKRLQRAGRIDPRELVRIGREVAAGLDAAHRRGLIHRDVKPDNIWLEENGRVKLLDFGLVRAAAGDSALTQSGVVLGTPGYMAPEQAQGEEVDARCDLFSLGAVLYHLATGQAPFDRGSITATLLAVVQARPAPLGMHCPGLHPDLSRLIEQLLSKDRQQRPATAADVARRLAEIENRLADSPPQKRLAAGAAADEERAPIAVSRRKWLILGAVLVLALLIPLGIRSTLHDKDENSDLSDKSETAATIVAPESDPAASELPSHDREAAQWVLDIGGEIAIDTPSETGVFFRRPDRLPGGAIKVTWIDLTRNGGLTDGELTHVAGLASLVQLNLSHTQIGDDGVAHLAELPQLVYLNLVNTRVTDAGLEAIQPLPKLRQLHLSRCRVGDGAIPVLLRMQPVELTLDGTDVTFEGLSQLPAEGPLRSMNIMQLDLSSDEVERLSELLPNCRLQTDFGAKGPQGTKG